MHWPHLERLQEGAWCRLINLEPLWLVVASAENDQGRN